MRVLYVTAMWLGLKDIVCEGATEPRGMPAFVRPLKKLVELGHRVDFVVGSSDASSPLNVGVSWLDQSRFHIVAWHPHGLQRLLSPIRLYRKVRQVLARERYDFVYCHGTVGAIGNLAALRAGIPCGIRLYGTGLSERLEEASRVRVALRRPLVCASYRLRKSFLVVTNDGTHGDRVHRRFAGSTAPYDFRFLFNGVDPLEREQASPTPGEADAAPFLLYPGRIDRCKRQHLAIELVDLLRSKGCRDVELQFAGHVSDPEYWQEIQAKVSEKELGNHVRYLGALPQLELVKCDRDAVAVLSMYQISNLGNVVIEALAAGAIVVSLNDGSLDGVIESGVNGVLVDDLEHAADEIALLLDDSERRSRIRACAAKRASEQFLSWDERSLIEIDLIGQAVARKDESRKTKWDSCARDP